MTGTVKTSLAASAAAVAGLALAGCGIPAPKIAAPGTQTAATRPLSTPTPVNEKTLADAIPEPERIGTIPPATRRKQNRVAPGAGARTPVAALETYAHLWATWTGKTVIARQRQLATISLGQARAQALQAAASFANDSNLTRSEVADAGQAIAVSKGTGPAAGQWVVVTSESTSGTGRYAGLPATLHVTYAGLARHHGKYLVSSWSPQN